MLKTFEGDLKRANKGKSQSALEYLITKSGLY